MLVLLPLAPQPRRAVVVDLSLMLLAAGDTVGNERERGEGDRPRLARVRRGAGWATDGSAERETAIGLVGWAAGCALSLSLIFSLTENNREKGKEEGGLGKRI